jgi:adenine/guanine phosphoribosyltransferase-like PRPP-binding protein
MALSPLKGSYNGFLALIHMLVKAKAKAFAINPAIGRLDLKVQKNIEYVFISVISFNECRAIVLYLYA